MKGHYRSVLCFQFHQGLSRDLNSSSSLSFSIFQFHQGLSRTVAISVLYALIAFNSIKDYRSWRVRNDENSSSELSIPSRIITLYNLWVDATSHYSFNSIKDYQDLRGDREGDGPDPPFNSIKDYLIHKLNEKVIELIPFNSIKDYLLAQC